MMCPVYSQAISRKQNKEKNMSEVLHINDAEFDAQVIKSDIPVLVDFWAPWCGPCKMIAPVLDELAPAYAGKVKIVKVNVDENQVTPAQFGVRSIPTLLLFKDGQLVATQVGALPKGQLAAFINQHI
jgi:thioredoxin